MPIKDRLNLTSEPVFLMDGSAFIYRGFFANREMRRSDGFPTNALVVVSRILLRILREEKPRNFVFMQDGRGKNFRHEIFPLYKANRDATPEDLVRQLEPIQRMVRALGLRLEISDGCEADDCIASLAARFSAERPVVIISGDKDLKQCLGPNVFMWDPAGREEKLTTEADFMAESGVAPAIWADVQALVGDTSDNIPGVPGIGPKTARTIFEICPSLEDIRDHFVLLPPKIQEKLRGRLEDMFTFRELTRLSTSVCADVSLEDTAVCPLDEAACVTLAEEFELHAVRREMASLLRDRAKDAARGASGAPVTPRAMPAPARTLAATANATAVDNAADATNAANGAGPAAMAGQMSLFAGEQLSLLSAPNLPEAPEIFTISDLPDCAGRTVAVIYAQGPDRPPHIAVEAGEDILFTGAPEDLCGWLAGAARLVTADLKGMLRASAAWRAVVVGPHALPCVDLGLAAYLLSPEESDYGWPRLVAHRSEACRDTTGTAVTALRMAVDVEARLEKAGLSALYTALELPLVPVLADMEVRGLAVDAGAFQAFLRDVQAQLDSLTTEVYAEAGTTFNIRSAQQLGEVLFTTLNLPAPRKTKGGQAGTGREILEKLAGSHKVVDSILQFRKLEKMRSTYLDPLPRLMDAKGRIHTTFNQKATATGRLSSSNPNLQNIPVRGPLGKRMRSCFIAGPGRTLVSADYSQVELRVLAHYSQDAALLDAFRRGEDIHTRTAALVYELEPSQVTADLRRNAKTVNFGLIYGMGAQKLAGELRISPAEAKEFIGRYFERLTGLKAFYENVEALAKEQGFVSTLGGRRRPLADIYSDNGQAFALARRQAINTVIQGSAADIIKLAMLAVAEDAQLRDLNARLLLQVHDELLLDAPEDAAAAVGARTAELMAAVTPGGAPLLVPLVVDWGAGADWGAAH